MGLRDMYRAGDIIEYEGGGRDYLVSIEGEEGLWVNACNSTWIERGLRDFCDELRSASSYFDGHARVIIVVGDICRIVISCDEGQGLFGFHFRPPNSPLGR